MLHVAYARVKRKSFRLKRLAKYKILEDAEYDPMRYLQCLEPAGFQDVKVRESLSVQPTMSLEKCFTRFFLFSEI